MFKSLKKIVNCVIVISIYSTAVFNAQPVPTQNSAELIIALEKLNVLGSVLYIAAHPDDENTGLMAYLSKGKKYRAGYLSITRGDGGQNLIGPEKGSEIGIIRTQELLQARHLDGAEQFFTRAIDFGYSKSPEETLSIWGKEEVLADIVWVIRNFRPDVVITRFPTDGSGGHGHHTASATLTVEAFKAAADPNRFPEQLKYVQPWQAKRLFWNTWRPSQNEANKIINIDTGEYNYLLGKSYTEIAAESRSMHKSQGFGVTPSRAPRLEYFQLLEGEPSKSDILEGVNTTWQRIPNGENIGKKIESLVGSFDFRNPSKSLTGLMDIYSDLNKLENNYWVGLKRNEILSIIQSCAGLWMEAISSDYSAAPGDEINIRSTLINRSAFQFKVDKIDFSPIQLNTVVNKNLEEDKPLIVDSKIKIPDTYPISQPYWLIDEPSKGLFKVTDQQMLGKAENLPSIAAMVSLNYNGQILNFSIPVLYRWNDRVNGELFKNFEVRPPVVANLTEKAAVFPDEKVREIQIKLKANSANAIGEVHLHSDGNWKIIPAQVPFTFKNKYDEQIVTFKITPPKNACAAKLNVELNINGKIYNKSLVEIVHSHIKPQIYFPESKIDLVKLDIKKAGTKIGYIMGSGDDIPGCLRGIGYEVTLLSDEMLEKSDLSKYDAIIAGIRAYNTRERIKFDQSRIMEYVKNGGTLVVQYNVSNGLQTENIGPYPFKLGSDRITVEEAELNFIKPDHQLLNFPNKITQKDFDSWIQERGLYFAATWDNKYETIFSGHDPNEKDLIGSTLFTRYGKGVFIYSGLAWFRQLPAGVPGAYRLFVNMISAGKYNGKG